MAILLLQRSPTLTVVAMICIAVGIRFLLIFFFNIVFVEISVTLCAIAIISTFVSICYRAVVVSATSIKTIDRVLRRIVDRVS